ncbi:hypothetical protein EAH72_34730 [Pseudomonas caspiana]|nr:hypothetical protein [Pseudomonas caspiana]TPG85994.1 hypothetical protein EAH72_34730 [Pseudomonas caspiana]
MNARDGHDPFAALNLPAAVRAQALKLLANIGQARTAAEVQRAADRAEGFGLGIETVKALYLAFDHAATARLLVLEQ